VKNLKEHYRNTYESYLQPLILENRSLLLCNLSNLVGFVFTSAIPFKLLEAKSSIKRNLFFIKIGWIFFFVTQQLILKANFFILS